MTIINRGWNGDISSMNHLDFMGYSDEPTIIESARAALGKTSIQIYWVSVINKLLSILF